MATSRPIYTSVDFGALPEGSTASYQTALNLVDVVDESDVSLMGSVTTDYSTWLEANGMWICILGIPLVGGAAVEFARSAPVEVEPFLWTLSVDAVVPSGLWSKVYGVVYAEGMASPGEF